jgi:tetratricopeptide (TPR) repeat protein
MSSDINRSSGAEDTKAYIDALRSLITPGLYVAKIEETVLVDLPVIILAAAGNESRSVRAQVFIRALERVVRTKLSVSDQEAAEILLAMGRWSGVPVRERHYEVAKRRNKSWTWERNYRKEPLTRDLMAVLVALQREHIIDEPNSEKHVPSDDPLRQDVIPRFLRVPDPTGIFVGREQELSTLQDLLVIRDGSGVTSVALHGLGGVGKTELATQYCHMAQSHSFVWWFIAASRKALLEELLTVANTIGLTRAGEDVMITAARLRGWLESEAGDWLLVFDNADDPSVLQELLPSRGDGSVLITSRYADWRPYGMRPFQIKPVSAHDALSFLARRTGLPADDHALTLVTHLDGLPLALQQVGAFVARAGWSYQRYLDMLNNRAVDILAMKTPGGSSSVTAYPWTVYTAWHASIRQATQDAAEAADVLRILSLLGAERIPRIIFSNPPINLAGGDSLKVEAAAAALATYSVIQVTEQYISLHRLTQEVEYNNMVRSDDHRLLPETIELAAELIHPHLPDDPDDSERWYQFAELIPHIISLSDHAATKESQLLRLGKLECHAAGYLNARGSRLAARELLHRARLRVPSIDYSALYAEVDLGLARVLRNLGDLSKAYDAAVSAVDVAEDNVNDDPIFAIKCYNILGRVLLDKGRLVESEDTFRTALEVVRASPYSNSRHAVSCLNNLGRVLLRQGKPIEARQLLSTALSMCPPESKPHADLAWTLDNLAMAHYALGNLSTAHDLLLKALAIEAQVHGSDHPRTAWSLRNLAHILIAAERLEEARKSLERSLEIIQTATPGNLGELSATAQLLKEVAEAQGDKSLERRMASILRQPECHHTSVSKKN